MPAPSDMTPYVNAAHYYPFPKERGPSERDRIGYCYAFHFIADGRGSVSIEGKSHPVRKGDLVFIPPLRRHTFHTSEPHLYTTYNVYCELWNDRPECGNPLVAYHAPDPAFIVSRLPCLELEQLPPVQSLRGRPLLADAFKRICELHQANRPDTDLLTVRYLHAFVMELCLLPTDEPPGDYRILALLERLERGESANAPVIAWAEEAGLSGTQFHALFKRTAGMPPHAYRTRLRMIQAAAALIESTRLVSDIAEMLGFASIHHFSKQFAAYYGESPSRFRQRYIRQ